MTWIIHAMATQILIGQTILKNRVSKMEPRNAAVKYILSLDSRCWTKLGKPLSMAKARRNKTEPKLQISANLRGRRDRKGKRKMQMA